MHAERSASDSPVRLSCPRSLLLGLALSPPSPLSLGSTSRAGSSSAAMSAAAGQPPGPPPPLTKDQIARIRRAPIHRLVKHAVYSAFALAVVGALANVTCLVLGAVWARNIIAVEKWCVASRPRAVRSPRLLTSPFLPRSRRFIFHYVCAAVLSTMWLGYSFVFERHIKFRPPLVLR